MIFTIKTKNRQFYAHLFPIYQLCTQSASSPLKPVIIQHISKEPGTGACGHMADLLTDGNCRVYGCVSGLGGQARRQCPSACPMPAIPHLPEEEALSSCGLPPTPLLFSPSVRWSSTSLCHFCGLPFPSFNHVLLKKSVNRICCRGRAT